MIDLYTWHTPNGRKVSIMLEEIGMTYNVFPINIAKDEQFQPHFLEVSPNNRIPAIVDKENNNYSLFESGAILMYLAEKSGKLINRSNEARRLYGVMDKRLGQHQYMSGKEYSIADISIWPWTARFDWQEIDLSEYKNVTRWYKEMADRPAVQKGWLVPQNDQLIPSP